MRILVTGAAGQVARMLVPALANSYELRLTDVREFFDLPETAGSAERLSGDLTDPAFAAEALAGMDAVVHLAANPRPGATWAQLRAPNADATCTVLGAARSAGVPRVVLASSVHAAGGDYWAGDRPVRPDRPPRPCCTYGATKAFAEALGGLYADSGALSVICLRLGAVVDRPTGTRMLDAWLSPGDLNRVVLAALAADVRFGVYFGMSANARSAFDIEPTRRDLGYAPVDDSEAYAGVAVADGESTLCRAAERV